MRSWGPLTREAIMGYQRSRSVADRLGYLTAEQFGYTPAKRGG